MPNRLDGCKALVVGCNSEVATAITRELAGQNATHIVGTYFADGNIEEVRREISALTTFDLLKLDQTNAAQVKEVVQQAKDMMGGLDVLVTAASRQWEGDYLQMPDEEIDLQITVNLTGTLRVIREAVKHMIALSQAGEKHHRAIGVMASVRGTGPFINHPYDAAKAGLIQHVAASAKAYGIHGIKIGAMAPGTIDVALEPIRHECSAEEYRKRWEPLTPLGGTPVTPAMVAEETINLLNSASITGETRIIDGGFRLMRPLPERADQSKV